VGAGGYCFAELARFGPLLFRLGLLIRRVHRAVLRLPGVRARRERIGRFGGIDARFPPIAAYAQLARAVPASLDAAAALYLIEHADRRCPIADRRCAGG